MTTETASISAPETGDPRFIRRLFRKPVAVVALIFFAVVVGVAVLSPVLLPEIAYQQAGDLLLVGKGPSAEHWLGTDTLGRDVLDRLLVGTRVTMLGVLEAVIVLLVLGVPLGLLAGYFRGRLDRVVMWLGDALLSLPGIIVVLVTLSIFRNSMLAAMTTFGILVSPSLMRVVRAAVLPIREELSIDAAKTSGLSNFYIITRHVLPRVAGPVLVQTSVLAATALIVQTGLSFLGLLIKAPEPSWGGMVADGVTVISGNPGLILWPGIAIALTILALGLLADGVRDAMTEGWGAPHHRPTRKHLPATSVSHHRVSPSTGLVSVRDLRVSFQLPNRTEVTVVESVSFEVAAGETVGLVGESGCGKTQTAMALIGLLSKNGRVSGGSINFDGQNLAGMSERDLRAVRGSQIGLVSQEPMVAFDPTCTIGSQISEVVRRHHGLSRTKARARTIDLLKQVNLPNPEVVYGRYPHELSGGMAQRACIARALSGEPKLLIADEPTTALDVTVQAEILDLLRDLQVRRGMAILLITHDWGVVADMCDRAVVMYAGQVVEKADIETIFEAPQHPYTAALLAANPHGSEHDARRLPTIPGSVPPPGKRPLGCFFQDRCSVVTDDCRTKAVPLIDLGNRHGTRCLHYERVQQ